MSGNALALGAKAPTFALPDITGEVISLNAAAQNAASVVVFTCNQCPYAQAWEERIVQLAKDYGPKDVAFYAINANATQRARGESAADMQRRATSLHFPFPYLRDDTQETARLYGATRTPEFFIFDRDFHLQYHGALDDNFDDPDAVEERFAADALDALIAGRVPSPATTAPLGCHIRPLPSEAQASQPKQTTPDKSDAQRLIYYALTDCPTCIKAKAALIERGVAFEERVVDDNELWQQEVYRLTGDTSVPVFVRDGVVEVGFEGEPGCHF
jgi:glutaredoxin